MTSTNVAQECVNLVRAFFGGDGNKTEAWFQARNPLLGNIAPNDMIHLNRTDRLLKFIKQQLVENMAPDSQDPSKEAR